jgi:hypothetical protein
MRHAVGMPLRLVNDKFMRGDVEEKPEIGNSEQIALLRKFEQEAEKAEKAAKAGKLDVAIYTEDIEYKVVCEFTCICGNKIKEKNTNYTDDWEELESPDYEGVAITCDKCGRKYEIDGFHAKLIEG